jgi:hypothetical protein
MGMLMLNILLSFGQYERELASERTADKLEERAKKGKWNGGWVPIGYEYDKKEQTLRPHPEETRFVQEIFELTAKLKNATAVAHELNKMGKRTRKRTLIRKDGTERVVGEKLKRAIFKTKIRTKWYRVNLGLYGSGLFPGVLNKGGGSSDFRLFGSADERSMRTWDSTPSSWASPVRGGVPIRLLSIRYRTPRTTLQL